jgi:hypothetical protein
MRKLLAIPFLTLLACQGTETTGQSESLICSGADVPVYRNRFAPQAGASGVATAPEAAAGIISSDAPAGTASSALPVAPETAPAGTGSAPPADSSPPADSVPPADSSPPAATADAGAAGGGPITAMVATCGPSPCSPGLVAVEAPPAVAATTSTEGPALAPSPATPETAAPAAAASAAPPPSSTTTLVCAPPPPSCPDGQSPQFTMKSTWECTDCSLVVTYGFLYGNYRRCVNLPHIECPSGQVPTWVFEHEQWECKTTCDNGQYDQHVAQGLLVCVPC